MSEVRLIPVLGIPEVRPGDDLAGLIREAIRRQGEAIRGGDVLAVAQKVVSKAEGRLVDLRTVVPSPFAQQVAAAHGKDARHVEVILRESRRVVRMDQGVIIAETHHGFVCANAGVDRSNLPGLETVCLLPRDPDGSAARLRQGLEAAAGGAIAVIITDTFGRPWREGLANVAIGVSGMAALRDYRGEKDPYGFTLESTAIAVADELAAAAELVMGKVEQVPAVIIRGFAALPGEGSGALIRPADRDLFR